MNRISKGVIGLSLAASIFSCESESISPNMGENLTIVSATNSGLLKSRNYADEYELYLQHIADILNVDIEEVVPFASFQNDLGADSLDFVILLLQLEDEFKIELLFLIAEEKLTHASTVIDLWDEIYLQLD